MPKFRTQYDETYKASIFFTDIGDPDADDFNLVEHSMQQECDVNYIMSLYQKTGELHHVMEGAAQFGDFSDVLDYQEAQNRIIDAQNLFMELPSKVRDRFNNDPAQFLEFATDPSNIDEMRKLGLANPAAPENVEAAAEPKGGARTSSPSPSPAPSDSAPKSSEKKD